FPITRVAITRPEGQVFGGGARHPIAISPGGTRLVYIAAGRLNLRSMSEIDAKPIQGIEGAGSVNEPVFSPDGGSIAFWTSNDQNIKRVAVTGGGAITICKANDPYGMSWTEGGILIEIGRASCRGRR